MSFTPMGRPATKGRVTTPEHGLPGAVLRRVLDHIEANVHRDPALSELSALAHMSAFHFARLFKRSTGMSPHRFVVARRIDRAKDLLENPGVSIAAVSRAVGFRTPSHFTTVFRRVAGMTPSAYRAAAMGTGFTATTPPASAPRADIEREAGADTRI
jgi:AraC family transcriptional regulator